MTRVLLVEDDEVIRIAVGRALERYRFSVGTAPDGLAVRGFGYKLRR